jgi:anaerobic ribonucleoside-triphosphate reductase activating protein
MDREHPASVEARLRLAQVVSCTEAEGPGRRFAVWVQGCPLRCPGCCNPEMLPFEGGWEVGVDELAGQVGRAAEGEGVEGITLLGGEPMAQAEGLAALAKRVQGMGLSVMVFSGFTLEEIRASADPHALDLLGHTDLLVDGPYLRDRPETRRRWVGSSNQRVHALTGRYKVDDPCWSRPNTLELRLSGGELTVNGFPATAAVGLWRRPRTRRPGGIRLEMRSVSRFEADLLRVLHAVLGRAPVEGVLPVIAGRRKRPKCLGREAVGLVQEALGKGCVWRLACEGGWLPGRHLRGDRVATGRLWERTPPEGLGLSFTRFTMNFLIWLTADPPGDGPVRGDPGRPSLSVGDWLVVFYAYEALRTTKVAAALRGLRPFYLNELCRLAFPDDFAEARYDYKPAYSLWTGGVGGCVLEALQPYLAARWVAVERQKLAVTDPPRMSALGRAQGATLDALLRALDGAGRWDLARFLLSAAATLLRDAQGPRAWVGSLDLGGLRVAERAEVHRAALAFLRSLGRLQGWERQARGVGYFDEGYAASQLWKADWEAHDGDVLCERAGAIARALDPLGNAAGREG